MYTQIFFVTSVRGMLLSGRGLRLLARLLLLRLQRRLRRLRDGRLRGLRSNRLGRRRHRDRRVDGSAHTP